MIDSVRIKAMFEAIATAIEAGKARLCELDGTIGDADHGIAVALGFNAVRGALGSLDISATDPATMLNMAAKSFLNAVGASSGPLYATAFMRAAAAVKGNASLDAADVVSMIQAMATGIQDRGKAELGEKTMLDAWRPAAEAAASAQASGADLACSLDAALAAARQGADGTIAMIATKGRSARLGERSIGHMDPGAASAVIILEAMRNSLA